jgi:hypothetical protein
MGTVRLRSIEDLDRYGAELVVMCRQCGRVAHFKPHEIASWFRSHGFSTSLEVAGQRFRCHPPWGCGARDAKLSSRLPELELPPERPKPKITPGEAPKGIDPERWAKADSRERKRLVRQLRS